MASACTKCNYFPVRCRCAEILLEVENKQLKKELKKRIDPDYEQALADNCIVFEK